MLTVRTNHRFYNHTKEELEEIAINMIGKPFKDEKGNQIGTIDNATIISMNTIMVEAKIEMVPPFLW